MDFTLEGDPGRYDLRAFLKAIRAELSREGYVVGIAVRDRRPVQIAFVRFRGLFHEAGLSPHRDENLAIRVEVDTRPPAGRGRPGDSLGAPACDATASAP